MHISTMISPAPIINLSTKANHTNAFGSLTFAMIPKPAIVRVNRKNPNTMKFLVPKIFFRVELNTAKIIYAAAKRPVISAISP